MADSTPDPRTKTGRNQANATLPSFRRRITGINELAHAFAASVTGPGDSAVDCTAGNGRDTIFLLGQTAPDGRVYSIDIQEKALEHTEKSLRARGIPPWRYQLVNRCHSELEQFIPGNISCFMFNLGYLPGGDHCITTRSDRVLQALRAAMKLLRPGGIITVVIYPHEEGCRERRELKKFAENLEESLFRAIYLQNLNTTRPSPSLMVLQKLR